MPGSDTLARLADELRDMTPKAQRQILNALTDAERDLLTSSSVGSEAPHYLSSANEGDGIGFSPWLVARIRVARDGSLLSENRMTNAASQALIRSVDAMVGNERPRASPAVVQSSGRSLVDVFGGFMSPRGARK